MPSLPHDGRCMAAVVSRAKELMCLRAGRSTSLRRGPRSRWGPRLIGLSVSSASPSATAALPKASTPIKHVVVLFDENISFDHYFGDLSHATQPASDDQPVQAASRALRNGQRSRAHTLLTANNPNSDLALRAWTARRP